MQKYTNPEAFYAKFASFRSNLNYSKNSKRLSEREKISDSKETDFIVSGKFFPHFMRFTYFGFKRALNRVLNSLISINK
jgi:hypothetical protein